MKMFGNLCYALGIVIAIGVGMGHLAKEVDSSQALGSLDPCPNATGSGVCALVVTAPCYGHYDTKETGTANKMMKLSVSDMMKQCYKPNQNCALHDAYLTDTDCEQR